MRLLEPVLDEERADDLELASAQASALADYLRDMSCDAGALGRFSAQELAERARDRVRRRARACEVDVVLHCTNGPVWVQREAFLEALYELLDNAVAATRRGHPVVVDARETGERDTLWQIQDTGRGMTEAALAELGRPPVTGVGLAWIVIEEHRGLLRFESALGVGTTASVWLPGQ